jgi:hypothetical protein
MLITHKSQGFQKNILFNLLKELGFSDIESFQSKYGLAVDGVFGMKSYEKLYNLLLNPEKIPFEGFYFKQVFPKKQIIWHHSAGWDNARGMFDWWRTDKLFHVATAIGISDNGKVSQGFDEQYWAASIGCKNNVFSANGVPFIYRNGIISNNQMLDEQAVAVEICNWGSLSKQGDKFFSWSGAEVARERVIELDYKGYKFFEIYTDSEIKSLKYWSLLNGMRFEIPLNYSYNDMFTVSKNALSGKSGLYTHNSYRFDKNDVAPQPKLMDMATKLQEYM